MISDAEKISLNSPVGTKQFFSQTFLSCNKTFSPQKKSWTKKTKFLRREKNVLSLYQGKCSWNQKTLP